MTVPDGGPYPDEAARRVTVDEPVRTSGPGPWGILADLVWLAAFGAAVWAIVAFSY